MINESKLDRDLMDLGFGQFSMGAAFLRDAVKLYVPFCKLGTVYKAVAIHRQTTPARVERNIRHACDTAMERGGLNVWWRYFGNVANPSSGRITNGDLIAGLWHRCDEVQPDEN